MLKQKKKKVSFKKVDVKEKLFSVNNFKYDDGKMLISTSTEVWTFAKFNFDLDITKPKDMESFLRKSYRALWATKNK